MTTIYIWLDPHVIDRVEVVDVKKKVPKVEPAAFEDAAHIRARRVVTVWDRRVGYTCPSLVALRFMLRLIKPRGAFRFLCRFRLSYTCPHSPR